MTTAVQDKAQRVVFGETLVEMAQNDERLVVLDGDLANSTRADIFEARYPDRFLQMGIAEQNMLGVGAGLAALGFVPWVSTFAAFAVDRALDSIRVLIAQTGLPVKIVGSYSGLLAGRTGKTHLLFDDVAVMRSLGGMTVIAPADAEEARQAMVKAHSTDYPVYIRLARQPVPRVFDDRYEFEIGKAVSVRDGTDVTLISTGIQTTRAAAAAEALQDELSVKVLHVPTLKPFDTEAIVEASETGLVVTAEEHSRIGGLGSAVSEVLSELHPVPVLRVGLPDGFGESAADEDLLEKYGISTTVLMDKVKAWVAINGKGKATG